LGKVGQIKVKVNWVAKCGRIAYSNFTAYFPDKKCEKYTKK